MGPVMGHRRTLAAMAVALGVFVISGCSTPAAPTPTAAKAAAPATAAPAAAQPTAAPTAAPAPPTAAPTAPPKTSFPEKGKTISLLVPYPPGGGSDIAARIFQPQFEKEIGVPAQVVNKGGAGSQIGVTEGVKAKADGYTITTAIWPTIISLYLDPERKASFTRKDFLPLAMLGTDPGGISVKADSPIKSVKDLVDIAKANPGKVSVGTSGLMSPEDFAFRIIRKQAGIDYNIVAFDGAGPGMTALMGGHIDAFSAAISPQVGNAKAGQTRIIASYAPEGKKVIPGLLTTDEQGFKGCFGLGRGWFLPAGTPKDVVDVLVANIKKVEEDPAFVKKAEDSGMFAQFSTPDAFAKYWDDMETVLKPLVDEAVKEAKK